MNHELAELYGELSILTVAKAGRIRWLGHVIGIEWFERALLSNDRQININININL